ncbi:MAG: hypothetical protein V4671_08275, partial [Armatimonadota bacterium]
LSLLGAAAAGAVLDPERLLWVPGQKTIFLPSIEVYQGQEFDYLLIDDSPYDHMLDALRYAYMPTIQKLAHRESAIWTMANGSTISIGNPGSRSRLALGGGGDRPLVLSPGSSVKSERSLRGSGRVAGRNTRERPSG